jgi:hypothetical protein
MNPLNYQIFNDVNAAVTQNSIPISIPYVLSVSAQVYVSGTSPTGTLAFQVSNDAVVSPTVPTNWSVLGTPISVSANGLYLIPKTDVCYPWVRLVWTYTSGSGFINAQYCSFGF